MQSESAKSDKNLFANNRILPVVLLFFLAPLFGEFLLGNLKFSELFLLPFVAPLYGGGAILIREIARHFKRGYVTMFGLGIAYTLIEEGLVDQLFFNANYFAEQKALSVTPIPFLGIDAWLLITLIAMHAIWSTLIPIVLVEAIFTKYGDAPWLNSIGKIIAALVFVGGSVWLAQQIYAENQFMASVPQLAGTAVLVVGIIVIALATRIRLPTARMSLPNLWLAGGSAFAASSAFILTEHLPGWSRVVACLAIAGIFGWCAIQWSQNPQWTRAHVVALAGGGIATYAWLGAVMVPETGPKLLIDHLGTLIIVITAGWLFIKALKNVRALQNTSGKIVGDERLDRPSGTRASLIQ